MARPEIRNQYLRFTQLPRIEDINSYFGGLIKQQLMDVKKPYAFLLLAFFLLVYILPLGVRDLFIPDETRYAEIPREMIAGGDWIVPRLNGLRYFEKPPLGYWIHAGSILFLGENNFAVRLPSAMAVGLSALLIFLLVNRACRNETKENGLLGILASLIFVSCFEVVGVGNIAVLDSVFSFFVTATLTAFYFATDSPPASRREKWFLLLSGLACGLAFMTKGFLAFALPVLTVAPYLVWRRRHIDLLRMSWLPIFVAVMVALPWGILIHLREPDFWRFFFWNEHIQRFLSENAQGKESFWFFFMAAPGLFMPWTFVIPAAVAGIRQLLRGRRFQSRLTRFSICWLVFTFLFFSVSSGKLLTYILPCFPPFAILMAFGLTQVLKKGNSKFFQWGVAATGSFFGIILLALVYVQIFNCDGFHLFNRIWKAMMVANGLVFMVFFCFWSLRGQHGEAKILRLGLAPLLFLFLAQFAMPDSVIERNAPGRLLEKHQNRITPDTVIIADEEAFGVAGWNLKRDDIYLLNSAGELTYGLRYGDAAGRLLDMNSASRMIDRNRGNTVLIARTERILELSNALPVPVYRDDSGPDGFVLWRY